MKGFHYDYCQELPFIAQELGFRIQMFMGAARNGERYVEGISGEARRC